MAGVQKSFTKREIQDMIKNEVKSSVESITYEVRLLAEDLKEIKKAILGDGTYKTMGIIDKVDASYKYVQNNVQSEIVKRGLKAIEHYEDWEGENVWGKIKNALQSYDRIKWLTTFLGIGSLAGLVSFIVVAIEVVRYFIK